MAALRRSAKFSVASPILRDAPLRSAPQDEGRYSFYAVILHPEERSVTKDGRHIQAAANRPGSRPENQIVGDFMFISTFKRLIIVLALGAGAACSEQTTSLADSMRLSPRRAG